MFLRKNTIQKLPINVQRQTKNTTLMNENWKYSIF